MPLLTLFTLTQFEIDCIKMLMFWAQQFNWFSYSEIINMNSMIWEYDKSELRYDRILPIDD
jgi:hypothetical protein